MALNKNTEIDQVTATYKTTNYDQFKQLDGNRNIAQTQITRLIKSIEHKNLLHQNPILVNKNMEIIDGQHRLLAAQALGVPVYYRIENDAKLEDTIILNANNRKWVSDDYLASFVKLGKSEYVRLKQFKDDYSISTHMAIKILGGLGRRRLLEEFRDGKFVIPDYELSDRIASVVVELRAFNRDGAWASSEVSTAVLHLLDKLDPKILLEKMKKHNLFLTRRVSTKEYLSQFEEILNFENSGATIELV